MPLKMPKETEKVLIASIKRFAADELDLNLGDLKASLVLDFIVREVGPTLHNAALDEAARYFAEKVEDLAGRHVKEFGYFAR